MNILDTRIMLIGESNYCMYANAFFAAWKKIGYQNITYYKTNEILDSKIGDSSIMQFWKRFERKTALGNHVSKLNRQILECALKTEPHLVFIYNSRYVFPKTLKRLKENGAVIFLYSNDNPFADFYPDYYWRYFRKGLPMADVGFVYRVNNIEDYKAAGCKRVCQL
ncbi:MAG: HAD family hydrolase, partial [Ruminococcus flavefaciens]|nr:HAD family hydrolase [Ruminococcus flavefaciens]